MSRQDTLVIAEKPSVARDLAAVLKATSKGNGFLYGNGYTVTWAIGHLVTLPEPHQINPNWKSWSFQHLPMIPDSWPLIPVERTKSQLEVVESLIATCKSIVCATDAGREGELIFRYIYEMAKSNKPVQRLWISSLTSQAIQDGFQKLKPSVDFDPLADAAKGRSRADWLVGMNLSRAYALMSRESFFVGRVQTPTLAMIVERDLKIQNFVPEKYTTIDATFKVEHGEYRGTFAGETSEYKSLKLAKEKRIEGDEKNWKSVVERVKNARAKILSIEAKSTKEAPPLLYDLTELQRHANRLFGFTAAKTLEVAQNLYEKHKMISYPRTDSRHLSESVANTLPKIVDAIRGPYEDLIRKDTGSSPLGKRFVDDAEVGDHHALIPTGNLRNRSSLQDEEEKIFDLICRRLLSAWQVDFVTEVTTVLTEVGDRDLFRSLGTVVKEQGWKTLEVRSKSETARVTFPNHLSEGQDVEVKKVEPFHKSTEPPPHLTEGTLLSAMETAGKSLEDQELAQAIKGSGLGKIGRAHV